MRPPGTTTKAAAFALSIAVAATPAYDAQAQDRSLLVIVHPKNPVRSLNALQLNALFTSNRRFWPNGDTVVVFNAPPRSANRTVFDRVVLGMTPDQAGRFWVDQQVRGGARPPRTAHSMRLAQAAIKKLRNAITYVPANQCPIGVRVVALIKDGRVHPPVTSEAPCKK